MPPAPRTDAPAWVVRHGDCARHLDATPPESVDACVTDPPYGIGFLEGVAPNAFDQTTVAYEPETWARVLRVLKPGGHLVAFAAPRAYHRVACAVETAGFEIRDMLHWVYYTGIVTGLDVSRAFDAAAKETRPIIGHKRVGLGTGNSHATRQRAGDNSNAPTFIPVTAPVTENAKRWNGWNTRLKPGHEPILLARKPINEAQIIDQLAITGTGAINIDTNRTPPKAWDRDYGNWPANVLTTPNQDHAQPPTHPFNELPWSHTDFSVYCPKPSLEERDYALPPRVEHNPHPTIKPVALMAWLNRLVTQPGGVVLDPFTGSGSTGVAAVLDGYRFVGFELSEEFATLARSRIAAAASNPQDTRILAGAARDERYASRRLDAF